MVPKFFELKEKRVTVMGLGRFGGGVGAVQFLVNRGARVTVTDLLSECELEASLAELDGYRLSALHLGGHQEQDFVDTDLVLVNPAVPRNNRYLHLARQRTVPMTSELNLFWQFNRGRTLGVTGSNGKSTTAALLHSILTVAGFNSRLGGNIGRSLLQEVDQIQSDDWVVLELSSFQLDDLNRLPTSPEVAVVTNFSPNHLDWHGSLVDYRRAKQTILRWQSSECTAILNQDDADVAQWPTYGRRLWFGTADLGRLGVFAEANRFISRDEQGERELALSKWLKLPGRHNLQNAMAAACAALAVAAPTSAIRQGLENFTPLPHRLQPVAEVAGRTFYNDSLATTPESAAAALVAFSSPIVLLAGGYDKQVDLTLLADAIVENAKAVALMGQTTEFLAELIADRDLTASIPVFESSSLGEAFQWACQHSALGDVVLLSPGCASYDWFGNFEERGNQFMHLVNEWHKAKAD